LPAVEDFLDDIGRKECKRQKPGDAGPVDRGVFGRFLDRTDFAFREKSPPIV